MVSLVADYSDSESDSDSVTTSKDNQNADSLASFKPRQFFSTSDSDEDEKQDDESDNDDKLEDQTQREKTELQNPFRNFGTGDVQKTDSVFQIPFLEQEVEKSAALERHVQMTHRAGSQDMINGKKICWNHRKGKCRFGHNCTYAHDSDIIEKVVDKNTTPVSPPLLGSRVQENASDVPIEYDESVIISSGHLSKTSTSSKNSTNNEFQLSPERTHSSDGIGKKGKKRPGLTQGLIPGKKTMKMFHKNS